MGPSHLSRKGETFDANHSPIPSPAKAGLLQPAVVPKGSGIHQQTRGCSEVVPVQNQGPGPQYKELLGKAVPPASVLPGKTQGKVPDLFFVEGVPRSGRWLFHELAVE